MTAILGQSKIIHFMNKKRFFLVISSVARNLKRQHEGYLQVTGITFDNKTAENGYFVTPTA
jgi:hypothetical protein